MKLRVRVPNSSLMFCIVFANLALPGVLAAAPAPPAPPASLSAVAVSSSRIDLSWVDVNTNETGYLVERSLNPSSGFVQVGSTPKNTSAFSNTGLGAATTFYYRVRASGHGGSLSAYSSVASATTLALPPPTATPTAPPPSPTPTATPTSPPPTATATPLPPTPTPTRTPTPPAPTATPTVPPPTATPTRTPTPPPPTATPTPTQPPATPTPTPTAPAVPAAPSGLAATAVSSSRIDLSWVDNSTNETGFKVLRSLLSAGPWSEVGMTAASSYADVGLAPATTYFYKVCAYNGTGVSPDSNLASAATLNSAPAAPTGLSSSAVSSSQINLLWVDASGNESGFKIERSTATSGWSQISTVGASVTTYASTGLSGSTTYSYRVRAYNTAGDSGYSNTASATTPGSGSLWSRRFGDVNDDRGKAVAVDGNGNVAVAGYYQGITDFGDGLVTSFTHVTMGPTRDIFVARYNSAGAHIWSRSLGEVGSEEANAVAIDSAGNVVITGIQGSFQLNFGGGYQFVQGGNDIFVAKYDAAGAWVWSKTIGSYGNEGGNGVAFNGSGEVVVTGGMDAASGVNFGGGSLYSAGFQDAFLVKYSATGAHVWSKRFGSTMSDVGVAVATDSLGNIYVTGNFEGTVDFGGGGLSSAGGKDVFVAKFSSSGAHVWSKRFGGTTNDFATGIAVDGAGDVAVSGRFQGSIDFGGSSLASAGGEDGYLAKLSGASGGHVWSKRFGGTTNDTAAGVDMDGSGNVVVTGHYNGSVDFGGGALASSSIDMFAAKYNSAGGHIWSRRYGDFNYQFSSGVAAAANGDVTLTGYFTNIIDLGSGVLTSATPTTNDTFVGGVGP